jgi:inner membrane protein
MDSLTQIVLGAAVGEAVMGKKVGNKAALWGAIAGTIPDLDVLAKPFVSELTSLVSHRAFTHSILFSVLLAPLLGWAIHKIYKEKQGTLKDWQKLAFLSLITHPLLDCFTSWGTQVFYPFHNYRVAFNTISVVDPIYTVPFAICLVVALFLKRESRSRQIWNTTGLVLSTAIMAFTCINKLSANTAFSRTLRQQGSSVARYSTYPLPLNLLWYVVAEEENGYQIGYYSVLGEMKDIKYQYIPKNRFLLDSLENTHTLKKLDWFSSQYWTVEKSGDSLIWHDLRFGLMNMNDTTQKPEYTFNYLLKTNPKRNDISEIVQMQPPWEKMKGKMSLALGKMWDMSMGRMD